MTEAGWLACTEPRPMLELLHGQGVERKLRLFGVACVRRIWHLLPDEPCRQITVVAEKFADKLASGEQLADAYYPVAYRWHTREQSTSHCAACAATAACFHPILTPRLPDLPMSYTGRDLLLEGTFPPQGLMIFEAAANASCAVAWATTADTVFDDEDARFTAWEQSMAAEATVQASALRDIAGNHFHPITLVHSCRTSTVVLLARAAYDERQLPGGELDLYRLAVLADALEEPGAPDELVAHLRSPGPHVRGCHVVDLCLGLS